MRRLALLLCLGSGCAGPSPNAPLGPRTSASARAPALRPPIPLRWVVTSGETLVGPRVGAVTWSLTGGRLVRSAAGARPRVSVAAEPLEELALVRDGGAHVLVARGARSVFRVSETGEISKLGTSEQELVGLGSAPGIAIAFARNEAPRGFALREGATLPRLPALPLRAAAFADDRTGAVVFAGVGLHVTRDGGATLTPVVAEDGLPLLPPDVVLDASSTPPALVANWYGRRRALVDTARARATADVPVTPGEGDAPVVRWIAGTALDPMLLAAERGAPVDGSVALVAAAGWAALVDVATEEVLATKRVVTGSGPCSVTASGDAFVVVCTSDDGPRWVATRIVARAEPAGLAVGDVLASVPAETRGLPDAVVGVPPDGAWMPVACDGTGVGACVLQPDGAFRTVRAPGIVGVLPDGRGVAVSSRGGALALDAITPDGARTKLGTVTGGAGAALDGIDVQHGDVTVVLRDAAGTSLATFVEGAAAEPRRAPAVLRNGRLVLLEGDSLRESVDGGRTFRIAELPAGVRGATLDGASKLGVTLGVGGATLALVGDFAPRLPALPRLHAESATAARVPAPTIWSCSVDGASKPVASGVVLLRDGVGLPLATLGKGVNATLDWLDPTNVAPRRATGSATAIDASWVVAGDGRGVLEAVGRSPQGTGLAMRSEGATFALSSFPVDLLPTSTAPLSTGEGGAAWVAGRRIVIHPRRASPNASASVAEPVIVGAPTKGGSVPVWIDAGPRAHVRWIDALRGGGPLEAKGFEETRGLSELLRDAPCSPPRGSTPAVGTDARGSVHLRVGGVEAMGGVPVLALAQGGTPCIEELRFTLPEPIAVPGGTVRWVIVRRDRAWGLTEPLGRVKLLCRREPAVVIARP